MQLRSLSAHTAESPLVFISLIADGVIWLEVTDSAGRRLLTHAPVPSAFLREGTRRYGYARVCVPKGAAGSHHLQPSLQEILQDQQVGLAQALFKLMPLCEILCVSLKSEAFV